MIAETLESAKCSGCGASGVVERFSRKETVTIRGLPISVTKTLRRCGACSGEFESSEDGDHRIAAYAAYREAKGMVTPETMVSWRENYGLKQVDVTALLGWGEATLGRYENGSLQSEAHDRMLADLMSPGRLSDAFSSQPDVVPAERRNAALARLREEQGLLSSEELRIVRVKYGLDAAGAGAIISVPESSWMAWETGESVQSASADGFIRLIARRPDIVRDLLERLDLLVGTTLEVLDRLDADVDLRVSQETGVSVTEVKSVEEGYRRALPEAAERLRRAA